MRNDKSDKAEYSCKADRRTCKRRRNYQQYEACRFHVKSERERCFVAERKHIGLVVKKKRRGYPDSNYYPRREKLFEGYVPDAAYFERGYSRQRFGEKLRHGVRSRIEK